MWTVGRCAGDLSEPRRRGGDAGDSDGGLGYAEGRGVGRGERLSSTKAAAAGPCPGRVGRGVRQQVPGGAIFAREGGCDEQVWVGMCRG